MTRKSKLCLISLIAIFTLLGLSGVSVNAETNWSDKKSELTVAEYLDLYFQSHLQSFKTLDKLEVKFVANQSPDNAVLYLVKPVVVPISDLPTRADQTKSLKHKSGLYEESVEALFKDPCLKKRWSGAKNKKNLIVHFIASHDRTKTIGLYSRGKRIFNPNKLTQELTYVKETVGRYFPND